MRRWDANSRTESSTVLQVKFVRDPSRIDDPAAWLADVVEGEREKVERLISRGAVRYILATNVPGTAHLDGGSIDRVNASPATAFPTIETACWWRLDLDGRLSEHWDLKWDFPELFTGIDFVRLLTDARQDVDFDRAVRALRAYLVDQYDADREVRFKQVDLSNDLLEMFTDVPIELTRSMPEAQFRSLSTWIPGGNARVHRAGTFAGVERSVGAADLQLLAPLDQIAPRMVILGAPGQGKSTLLQYVVQVHRARLLGAEDLDRLGDKHRLAPVRLPFRIELRDFARFLRDGRPWEGDDTRPVDLPRTLEGFISAQVKRKSGGGSFTVDALLQMIGLYPVLLALDGLDEVVHVDDRETVVRELSAADRRLRSNAHSLITIVTSRPLAFANSPSLQDDTFPHLQLGSLTPQLIEEYTTRWTLAHHFSSGDAEALQATLAKRLQESHFADLARNPMQLAILLNLIHRLGEALPDQRTNLYRRYMDIFLDREADKSPVVRDHRELLVRLHGKLAWRLHAEAERAGGVGRISRAALNEFAETFLKSEGWPADLFGDLFTRGFERMGALVSRQQDAFEFEVQPVREYFAGSYLYDSAPPGPVGSPCAGTRPDRFDALARRPYWLNTLRFFAGSYSTGELASLADRLEILDGDPLWSSTAQPRLVAAGLTIDRTFEQDLRSADKALTVAMRSLGVRHSLDVGRTGQVLHTSAPAGSRKLLESAIDAFIERPEAMEAIPEQLRAAYSDEALVAMWRGKQATLPPGQFGRLGEQLGLLAALSYQDLRAIFGEDIVNRDVVRALIRAGRCEPIDDSEEVAGVANRLALDGLFQGDDEPADHPLWRLARRTSALVYQSRDLESILARTGPVDGEPPHEQWARWNAALAQSQHLIESGGASTPAALIRLALSGLSEWLREEPLARDIAAFVAGLSDRKWRRRSAAADPFDITTSVLDRARYARLTDDVDWWTRHFATASDADGGWLAALAIRYGSPGLLTQLATVLERVVTSLPASCFPDLAYRVNASFYGTELDNGNRLRNGDAEKFGASVRLLALMRGRLPPRDFLAILCARPPCLIVELPKPIASVILESEVAGLGAGMRTWSELTAVFRDAETAGVHFPDWALSNEVKDLPPGIAEEIVQSARTYPPGVVAVAEERLLTRAIDASRAVADAANEDGWFA